MTQKPLQKRLKGRVWVAVNELAPLVQGERELCKQDAVGKQWSIDLGHPSLRHRARFSQLLSLCCNREAA